jgi:hypothetical protein
MGRRSLWSDVRPGERLAVTRRATAAVRSETAGWLDRRGADFAFARFAGHLGVLRLVTGRMLDAIEYDLGQVDLASPDGFVYDRCRDADARLAVVARLLAWYAEKYDQRDDPTTGPVLRAADEVVRSCWAEAFAAIGKPAPTGPLVHLEARFDAAATPRVSTPTDLRAPRDAVIGEFVRELPIPVVALPAVSRIEPWWIVLAAHETGHHLQYDLADDLVARTRAALAGATGAPAGDETTAACWAAWGQEVFADAVAALTVGPAAAWAVDELQYGPVSRLVTMPSPAARYPPPVVRTALLGELARALRTADPGPGADDVTAWLDGPDAAAMPGPLRAAIGTHLRLVRAATRGVLGLEVDGVPLPEIFSGLRRPALGIEAGEHCEHPGEQSANGVAVDLLAYVQILLLHDTALARIEPKTLRYRLLHVAARLTGGQRRRWLCIDRHWPWAPTWLPRSPGSPRYGLAEE